MTISPFSDLPVTTLQLLQTQVHNPKSCVTSVCNFPLVIFILQVQVINYLHRNTP